MLARSNTATFAVPQTPARPVIRAELIGGDTCAAGGIVAEANTPVLELCRKLIAAGHHPAARLEAYRGATLCLRVRSIGEAAALELNARGTGFIARPAVRTASPIRFEGVLVTRGAA